MLKCSQQDLEAFLTQIYRAIAGAAPLKDKVCSCCAGLYVHFVIIEGGRSLRTGELQLVRGLASQLLCGS